MQKTKRRKHESTLEGKFWSRVDKGDHENACWGWNGSPDPNGYGFFRHRGKYYRAHRLSHEIHIGPIPDGYWVQHLCNNRFCTNPLHLLAALPRFNSEYAVQCDRMRKGQDHGRAVLRDEQVIEIRNLYAGGNVTQMELAEDFGVSKQLIQKIVTGRIWKHIGGPKKKPRKYKGWARKLDKPKVREIRRAYEEDSETYNRLASRFDVSVNTIAEVIKRRTWKHVA